MLQINKRSQGSGDSSSNRPDTVLFENLRNITGIMNRQRPIAVVVFICCFALGVLYYLTTPASFTAGGSIVIDKRKLQLFQKESILGEPDIDAATVQREVEVLKSDNIGLAVVRRLHLADDPEFTGSSKGPVRHFMALLGSLTGFSVSERVPTESERENAALLKFNVQRTLNRVGMTCGHLENRRSWSRHGQIVRSSASD